MTEASGLPAEERVLILAPTARDAAYSGSVLGKAGLAGLVCPDADALCRELGGVAGAVLLTEDVLAAGRVGPLAGVLRRQPTWSDLPVLLLARGGADAPVAAQAMGLLGNVTVLDRPTRFLTLVAAVRTALRARRRQYQLREELRRREQIEEALREADRRKDEFLAMLAHELRNPLAPVRNAVQVFRLLGPADANLRWAGDVIDRQVGHLARLVDDLLDVSRITRGKINLLKEVIDLATVVAQAVETCRPLIEARRHELTVALPPEPVRLEGDLTRLVQVVANLLVNAAKYTPEGGRIHLAADQEGGQVAVRVRDTGVGLPPAMLPKVFDLFVQADGSLARSQGGLGIGLTLVKSLVQLHGGSVEAHSEGPGRGSEFVVRLPALPAVGTDLPQPGAGGTAPRPGTPRRVLIVDDNEDAAESLALLLRVAGHEVWTAHSGPAGLALARQHRPEVVLLDIGLPGMDGYQVARGLRQDSALGGVTIVAMTGYGQDEDRRRSAEAGFDSHLVKPVAPEVVQEILATARGE